MSDETVSVETIRAKQRARRNGVFGVLGTIITASASIIVQLVQVTRADAEKAQLTESASHMQQKLDDIDHAVNALSIRITAVEVRMEERGRKP